MTEHAAGGALTALLEQLQEVDELIAKLEFSLAAEEKPRPSTVANILALKKERRTLLEAVLRSSEGPVMTEHAAGWALTALLEQWRARLEEPGVKDWFQSEKQIRLCIADLEAVLRSSEGPPALEEWRRREDAVDQQMLAKMGGRSSEGPAPFKALLLDLRELEQLYNTDRIAQLEARQIERIFDRWLHDDPSLAALQSSAPSAPGEAPKYSSGCTEQGFPEWWEKFGKPLITRDWRVFTPEMIALAAWAAGAEAARENTRLVTQSAPGEAPTPVLCEISDFNNAWNKMALGMLLTDRDHAALAERRQALPSSAPSAPGEAPLALSHRRSQGDEQS